MEEEASLTYCTFQITWCNPYGQRCTQSLVVVEAANVTGAKGTECGNRNDYLLCCLYVP